MSKYFNDWGSDEEILHYGVKGMKWRKRRARTRRDVQVTTKAKTYGTMYGISRNEREKNRKYYEDVLDSFDRLKGSLFYDVLKSKEKANKLRSTTNWRKLVDINKEIDKLDTDYRAVSKAEQQWRDSDDRNYTAQKKKRKR